jgi:hypothetical protein
MTHQTTSPLLPPANQLPGRKLLIHRLVRAGYRVLREEGERLWGWVCSSARIVRNLTHRLLLRSDYPRWTNLDNYEAWWDGRTEKIARLIPPTRRVIEFGAGRRQLEKRLDPTCTYVPSDLMERGSGTFVCDLNRRPLPDLSHLNVDTAIFGGVLEYIHDPESLVEWLAQHVSLCVASYACVPLGEGIFQRLRDRFNRFYYGYMNSYREEDLVDLFRRAGFRCIARDPWNSQRVFLFVNQRARG